MRKLIVFLCLVSSSIIAHAAPTCVAIAPTASGSGNGTSWSNARAGFPTLVRGTRYYVADGTYSASPNISTAASGTTIIEIRKAQSYDFGRTSDGCANDISAGFNSATMGAAQAIWAGANFWDINANYILVNGNGTSIAPGCGGSSTTTLAVNQPTGSPDCGILINNVAGGMTSGNPNQPLLYLLSSNNVTVQYVELIDDGNNNTTHTICCGAASAGNINLLSHLYAHNAGCVLVQNMGNYTNIDHSDFWGTEVNGGSSCHGQAEGEVGSVSNSVRSNNIYRDITGTAIWTWFAGGTGSVNMLWYNNIVYWSPYGQVTSTTGASGACPENCLSSTGGDAVGKSFLAGQTIYLGSSQAGSTANTVGTIYSNTLVSLTTTPSATGATNFYTVRFGGTSDALWDCINGVTCNNWAMYNNTIVNCHSGAVIGNSCGVEYDGNTGCSPSGSCGGGSYAAENNLWYNTTGAVGWVGGNNTVFTATTDFNSFLNTPAFGCGAGGTCTGNTANVQISSGAANPFVAWPSPTPNFALVTDSANYNNRTSGGSIPTIDVVGTTFTTDRGAYQFTSGAASFTCTPTSIPANQITNIAVVCTGIGTSWNGSTAFTVSGVTGATLVSVANSSPTSETLQIVTGSGTGTLTILDSTDTISTTITVIPAVTIILTGSGRVTSSPIGISCPGTCSTGFASGTSVTLTATGPFASWGGTCSGSGNTLTCPLTVTANNAVTAGFVAALPAIWVNNNEASVIGYEYTLGASAWSGATPPTCTFSLPYALTAVGLQSAINAMEACRTLTGVGFTLDIPPGLYTTAATPGIVIPQSNTTTSTSFITLRSTRDSSLPSGQTVCSHGIQDNLGTSTDIGLDNPDCAGDVMYYQLGTTITTIPAGPFTLANGFATNTSAYNDVQYMWTAECSSTNCTALSLCSPIGTSGSSAPPRCANFASCPGAGCIGPDHWLIEDMEARMSVGNTGNNIIVNTSIQGTETTTAEFASHIHFRKDWAHGDWSSLTAGANSVSAGFGLAGCVYCSVVDSQVSQALRPGAEGHSILANGTTYKINHNWLEGSSSGIFSGGFSGVNGPSIVNYVPFQDVEVRRNRLTFPYAWLGVLTVPAGNTHNGWAGQSIARKNAEENKEGERVLFDGNIIENVDKSGGQNGTGMTLTPRNTSAGSFGANYQSTMNDYTLSNNIIRNACGAFQINSRSTSVVGDGGGTSNPMRNFLFQNVLEYNIGLGGPGCTGVNNFGNLISSPSQRWQGTITENAAGTAATFVATCSIPGGDCPAGPPSIGFQVTDLSIGDPVWISGCTLVTAFNASPTRVLSGFTVPTGVGPLAISPTSPSSLSVTFPVVATPNAVDNSNNCVLSNVQGMPSNLLMTHVTFINNSNITIPAANTASAGPAFLINHLFRDSIYLTGGTTWNANAVPEGTQTEAWSYDITTMTADHMVFPGRTAANYTEYGNNPAYPDSAGCTGTGCSPPTTMFFPTTSYCTGASATAACVGFLGAMSASSMPLTLNDYHQFALITGSSFKAAASDGSDIGANFPAIDAAQTLDLYLCAVSCGSPGPFPDVSITRTAPVNPIIMSGNNPTSIQGVTR